MLNRFTLLAVVVLGTGWCNVTPADGVLDLRLVPFPKHVRLESRNFVVGEDLILEAPAGSAKLLGRLIGEELERAGLPVPKTQAVKTGDHFLRLSSKPGREPPTFQFRHDATPEDYVLKVGRNEITCGAPAGPGLFYGTQTLCQLIRANRRDGGLPCVTVYDWPSMRWRCFQDDMTRGPSSKLDTLKFEVALGAHLKMNLFTYYMEYQYAFKKHPLIGPKNGSLEPDDLAALVKYAKPLGIDILGNQQSFGHFARILEHEQYAHLRENSYILCPVKEESYKLLDDMYSEVCPILPFPFFNVCCDETWGLGEGPSKELAAEIGVGGVYVRHIRRIHDILKGKYKKRMMMWGDIILKHPDKLGRIPKDTIMLTWGYGARPSFENQIIPFAQSGYEFFVCPGISNWSRILPDFGVATTNIHNFVRDGAKHGALGMLNTAWEDDGDAIQGYKWHGYVWGAECAWNTSRTRPEDFNRRVGAVLFGEKGDHFGQAIELLAQTHRLPGMRGMNNKRFWENDFKPGRAAPTVQASADRLLAIVRPAIEHLEACKKDALVNAALLDSFLLGARRMELIGQRMLDGLAATQLYTEACEAPRQQALELLDKVDALVRTNRDAHAALGREFQRIWLSESKPYALDWTMDRYAAAVKWYDDLAARLAEARKSLSAGGALPPPEKMGLAQPETFDRRSRPHQIAAAPLAADSPWAEPAAVARLGLMIKAGPVDRRKLPIEVDVAIPPELASRPVRAFCQQESGPPQEILAQLDPSEKTNKTRLTLLIPGPVVKNTAAQVHVYLGLPKATKSLPQAVRTTDAPDGMKWIENDKVRLLLGSEGAHVYRWEVKGLDGRDLTQPGQSSWSGFSDVSGHRTEPNTLVCTAWGPALVKYVCKDATGLIKTIRLFGGTSWMEVVLSEPIDRYWDFDNPRNFAADGPTPGTYLFSNGKTGQVGRQANGVPAQVKMPGVHWSIKFNPQKLALGIATPEVAAYHHLAPGAGAGGVGIERSEPVGHFITYAGLLEDEPGPTMNRLRQTLDFKNQPQVIVHAVQAKQ